MPRLLIVTQTHNLWGGIESWMDGLLTWLQDRGWDACVGLAKGRRHNDPEAFRAAHPAIRDSMVLDASTGTEEARIRAIARATAGYSPDIVLPLAVGSIFEAVRRLRRKGGRPFRLVIPVHSLNAEYLRNVIENIDVIDQVGGVSRLIERYLRRTLPGEQARIHYVRNGVPAALAARPDRPPFLRLGYVGRLDDGPKRVSDLSLLCRLLRDEGTAAEMHVYGDGEAREALELAAKQARPSSVDVVFHGKKDRAQLYRDAYPNLDVLLLFSRVEGSPLALYEAMLHGVVPVVSEFLGIHSEGAISPERNGLTFPVGDMAVAARQIHRLATEPGLWEALGGAARVDAGAYAEDLCFRQWESLLESALRVPPRPAVVSDIVVPSARGSGRLDAWGLSPAAAERVRGILRTRFPHIDGWAEWPGTAPPAGLPTGDIEEELRALDRAGKARTPCAHGHVPVQAAGIDEP